MQTISPSILQEREKKIIPLISQIDPLYAIAIETFISLNPIFQPYLAYIPSNYRPPVPKEAKTVKQIILYYICSTGVRVNFAKKLFLNIYNSYYNKKENIEQTLIFVNKNKKQSIKQALLLPDDYSLISFKKDKLQGIGPSGTCFILSCFESINEIANYTCYTDTNFCKGLQKIYKLNKRPSSTEAKKIVDTWKSEYKIIGSILCFQAYNYA